MVGGFASYLAKPCYDGGGNEHGRVMSALGVAQSASDALVLVEIAVPLGLQQSCPVDLFEGHDRIGGARVGVHLDARGHAFTLAERELDGLVGDLLGSGAARDH